MPVSLVGIWVPQRCGLVGARSASRCWPLLPACQALRQLVSGPLLRRLQARFQGSPRQLPALPCSRVLAALHRALCVPLRAFAGPIRRLCFGACLGPSIPPGVAILSCNMHGPAGCRKVRSHHAERISLTSEVEGPGSRIFQHDGLAFTASRTCGAPPFCPLPGYARLRTKSFPPPPLRGRLRAIL